MTDKTDKKPDLRDKMGPGVAIDMEQEHSVLDRARKPSDTGHIVRPNPDQSTVPEGQNNKGGA